MARKSYSTEQITAKIAMVVLRYNQGLTIDEACKAAEIGKATFYRWRQEYWGMDSNEGEKTGN